MICLKIMKFLNQNIKMQSLILKISVVSALILFSSPLCFSQVAADQKKAINEIKYTEELSVQTDRDIYIAGEKVFLKIFKLNGITRTPGNISKVVYTDLLDNFNNPVIQIKIGVNGFSGSAEFILPDTLRTGNYLIRSCTNWMQNFSSDLFSYKRISVINPFESIDKIKVPVPGQQPDSIAFYPESGKLVSGIESVVGFRCYNRNGNPVGLMGIVIDSNSDTLYPVLTNNSGSGFFSIKPKGNGKIYLVAGENKDNVRRFTLPVVQDSGIVFSVINSRNQNVIKVDIRKNGDFTNAGKRTYLVYSPVLLAPFKKEIIIEKDMEILLQKDTLPAGLAKITIIDGKGLPLASRWIYNDKAARINYNINLQNSVYSTREKVRVDITLTDNNGNPVKSDLMVSVVKSFSVDKSNCGSLTRYEQLPILATQNTDFDNFNINDYLIFYSNKDDLFKSDKTGIDAMPAYLPELGSHLVSGTISNTTTGGPLKNENVVLSFVGKTARCRFSRTDEKGCFNFEVNEYGTREMVIQPLSPLLNEYYVELNNPFPEAINRYTPVPFYPDSSKLAEINSAIISMQVKNIYEPFVKTDNLKPDIASGPNFYGEPVETILMSNYIELTSLREAIKEIVPGVSVYRENDKSYFKIANESMNPVFETNPLVLVDGVKINDIDKILTVSAKDIEKIEILKSRYFISDIVIEGIIHFVTKKGNLSVLEFDRSAFRQEFEALQPVSKFNSPDYSVDSLKNSRIPDFRNTLYWNPDIIADETGKTTVEFYTSDETGEYTIIVNGISSDGRVGKSETTFVVKSK